MKRTLKLIEGSLSQFGPYTIRVTEKRGWWEFWGTNQEYDVMSTLGTLWFRLPYKNRISDRTLESELYVMITKDRRKLFNVYLDFLGV